MSPVLLLSLAGLFVSIALLPGVGASMVLVNTTTERRRLRQLAPEGARLVEQVRLTEQLIRKLERVARVIPKSPKEMSSLRRRLAAAGIQSFGAAVLYAVAEFTLPFLFGALPLRFLIGPTAWVFAGLAAMVGYMIPGLILARLITLQKRRIENGLPDALDLMIVCVEAGSFLTQAIAETRTQLRISHTALVHLITPITM